MKLKQFIQQETVLTAAAVLAVVSAFFVPPDAQYLGYIDLRTLAILFSLMTVMQVGTYPTRNFATLGPL